MLWADLNGAVSMTDVRTEAPKPPFDRQRKDAYPGHEADLHPKADHGEQSYRGHGRLTGKAALVTGADSGIGRAVALAFAREGADVMVSYLEEDADADETARLVADAGRRAVKAPGDIADERHCRELVERAHAELGGLDILVNNAAFQQTHERIEDFTPEEIEHTFRVNIFAMFHLSRAALPQMRAGSAIINTSSIEAFDPEPSLLAYAATKAAIVNFTKGLAKLAGKQGVRVNAVAPGPVWTPLIPATMPEDQIKTFGQDTIFGRPAQPAELAPVYVFLASEDARYVSGEVYGVTGGRMPV
jgi:NAD(P)-dependent dehydrogenase (short-subunit alcohol dehydrogenase family)